MYKSIIPAALILFLIGTGCNQARFKKLDSGLEYKIIKGSGDKELKAGDFVSMVITQYYNDSLMSNPFDSIPQIIQLDSMRIPAEYVRIFLQSKGGDSIVTRISTDTIAKQQFQQRVGEMGGKKITADTITKYNLLPPFAKEHQFFGTRFKIVDVYKDQAEAMKAQEGLRKRMMHADSLAMENQKKIDDKTLTDYLKKNNINAVRTPQGTYVQVINEGTGKKVDSGSAATVLYKGMLLDGTIFDQSYDSTGNPIRPYTFVVGQMGGQASAIEGWSDGMVYFKEGGEGKLFVPSARAYGSRGAGQDIKPNTPIMFDVKVTKVLSKDEYQKSQEDQRKKLEALQKKAQTQSKKK